jgi:hypothetical protein
MKRVILSLLYLLFLVHICVGLGGVSPSYYEVDFEPNLRRTFSFGYAFDSKEAVNFSVSGDLAEYFKIIEKTNVFNRIMVVVEMNLPEKVDVPGPHRIRIGGQQTVSGSSGVAITGDVGGIIKLMVPYPGKYAELELMSGNVNSGEDVLYELKVYSRGDEDIFVEPELEIYDSKGFVKKIILESRTIESTKNHVYKGSIKTDDLSPGDYNLKAIVEFGGESPTEVSSLFRLGELRVEIINYTRELPNNKIGRYFIEIESFWNDNIGSTYAEFRVIGYSDKSFITPTISLKPWSKSRVEGFLDTSDIEEEYVQGEITVYYTENKSTSKIVELRIVKGIDWLVVGIVSAVVVFLSLILLIVVLLIFLLKKRNKR